MKRRRRNSGADFAQVRTSFNSEHRTAHSTLPSRWERLAPSMDLWIPEPRVRHPYPDARFTMRPK